jgi:transcriptional regulator with XRE-family HTH domain
MGLRQLREARVLSQRDLARSAKVSQKTIVDLEAHRLQHPHPRTLRKLAEALRMEPEALLNHLRTNGTL